MRTSLETTIKDSKNKQKQQQNKTKTKNPKQLQTNLRTNDEQNTLKISAIKQGDSVHSYVNMYIKKNKTKQSNKNSNTVCSR